MSNFYRGDLLNIVVGVENPAARGTKVDPIAAIPGRAPSGINVDVIKTLMKETRGSGIASQGSEIVGREASGPFEFNLRSETIGYILKTIAGACNTATILASVKEHTFTIPKAEPETPTLTFGLAGGPQEYAYPGGIGKKLVIKTPVNDLVNCVLDMLARDEEEHADYDMTGLFSSTDYIFRPQDITIKIATNIAGLAAAPALAVKEFSYTHDNGGKAQRVLGSAPASNHLAGLTSITGDMVLDFGGKTYHDYFVDGDYKALQITLQRTDIDLDVAHNHPRLIIELPRVSIEKYNPERPIDDIIRDKFSFVAHFDETEDSAFEARLQNTVADYDYEPAS